MDVYPQSIRHRGSSTISLVFNRSRRYFTFWKNELLSRAVSLATTKCVFLCTALTLQLLSACQISFSQTEIIPTPIILL